MNLSGGGAVSTISPCLPVLFRSTMAQGATQNHTCETAAGAADSGVRLSREVLLLRMQQRTDFVGRAEVKLWIELFWLNGLGVDSHITTSSQHLCGPFISLFFFRRGPSKP